MSIIENLIDIQSKLKVPKSNRNTFGGFNYRSCEDILEACKPLLAENKVVLLLMDEVVQENDRTYIKATATLINENNEKIEVSAFAREPVSKKGMDENQVTGATSSYARKYALNGLFCIDDTKDSDEPILATASQVEAIISLTTEEQRKVLLEKYKINELSKLALQTAENIIKNLKERKNKEQ